MEIVRNIAAMLDGRNAEALLKHAGEAAEIRLRAGRKMQISCVGGSELLGDVVSLNDLHRIVNRLMENSLYSREEELRQGYFTAREGCRVGVCGKICFGRDGIDRMANIGSACIRIPREAKGCALDVFQRCFSKGLVNVLILSPPGLGKTTLLRDLVRMVADSGWNVGIADERREIAACTEGVPTLDVGCRSDVLDGCPKALAIPMLVRSCAPQLIAADEIGAIADAEALLDASRCGVKIVATAHATDIGDALSRRSVAALIREGIFDCCVVMGPSRGQIRSIESLVNVR